MKNPTVVFSATAETTLGAAEPGKVAHASKLVVPRLSYSKGWARPSFSGALNPSSCPPPLRG